MAQARVLLLAAGMENPSARFRVRQYVPYLEAEGVQVELGELAVPTAQRRRLLTGAGNYDAVLVHRALLRSGDYVCLRRSTSSYVFDVDDAIMFRDSAHRNLYSWQRRLRFRRMARGARLVIAGNNYLKNWAACYHARAVVIPTGIELKDYPICPPGGAPEPIIGWIGTRVNLMYLRTIHGALSQIGHNHPQARLKVVCDAFPDINGIDIIRKPWTLADEPGDARSFHIGIMPLPDDAWTRGKCGLKLLQYMAASVPVVCSPTGANSEIVKHEVNGLYANTEAEWVNCLGRLLNDAALRARLGQAGRATVEARYSIAGNAPRFLAALLEHKG